MDEDIVMDVHFVLRMPRFPVIVASANRLYCALSPQKASDIVLTEMSYAGDHEIVLIDLTGEEFPYHRENSIIAPSFLKKRWTKKRIIHLFNSSENAGVGGVRYSERSLTAKTYGKIFADLVDLIETNPVKQH